MNNNNFPEVTVTGPNGGERIGAGAIFTITWSCTKPKKIASQQVGLPLDEMKSFSKVIASGLAGKVGCFDWKVPEGVVSAKGRGKVIFTDLSEMSTPDESRSDFVISSRRTYAYVNSAGSYRSTYEDGLRVTSSYDPAGNRIQE